jgi:asparagine synthase (glutamine-hydrolysing)
LFHDVHNEEDITRILLSVNGFFYLAIETEEKIFLVTDIVRSYPIFYNISNNEISICKNAFDLASGEELSIKDIDVFLTCGYTLGNKTIFQGIFQVESANLVAITKANGKIESTNYYNPIKLSYKNFEKEKLFVKLYGAYERAVQKALDYAHGRTIIVPLSGGYDSRLIVMILKKLGAKDVICHAYGTKHLLDVGHSEIRASKQVAKQLGFKWVFTNYSYSEWNKLMHKQNTEDYIKFLSKGVTTISYQNWLAISELKKRNLVPPDSVFVPGHTGDFIAGSAIPLDIDFNKTYTKQEILKTLSKRYFNLFPFTSENAQLKICDTFIHLNETYSAENYVRFVETFSWKEYHSKFIANSAQVYNLYNYDWYYPLWEREIVDLWFSVHPKEKIERALYIEFIAKYFKSSIPYVANGNNKNLFLKVLFKICKVLKISFLINNQYGIAKTSKLSLFFKEIPIFNELKDSFVLKNSIKKLRKVSINGIGCLQVLLTAITNKKEIMK